MATTSTTEAIPQLLPLELVDKCVGSNIWVVMQDDKGMMIILIFEQEAEVDFNRIFDGLEFSGTLVGFDDFVSKFIE